MHYVLWNSSTIRCLWGEFCAYFFQEFKSAGRSARSHAFCSTQLSSLGNEMWWAGICGTSLVIYFFSPLTPSSRLWRQCALLLLPPTLRATLRHWQDSIYYKYSTHCLNHPLFLQERRTGSSPWPQKTMTYTTPSPPLHSTALPLLWAWAFTQKLILPREAFLNLEKRGCS